MTNPNSAYQPNGDAYGGGSYGGQSQQSNPFGSSSDQYGYSSAPYGGSQQSQNLPAQQDAYQSNYGQQPHPGGEQKSWLVALLLCFFLGELGVHNFYIGRTQRGMRQLGLAIVGFVTSFILIGFILIGVLVIWKWVELVFIAGGLSGFDKDADGVPLKK